MIEEIKLVNPEIVDDESFSDLSDFEDVGDIYEDFSGDFTKKLNVDRCNGYQPNKQTNQRDFFSASAIKCQQLRSGEAFIQKHLDSFTVKSKSKFKDRSDRATVEQVLDPRTRMILFKLLQKEVFETVEGCVSTGKEANVYHAITKDCKSLAVKIYKTSILTFKDRDRYVNGEFRYRNGYCRHNPRKMVATWAEKEMRNLMRMHQSGLRVPKPLLLKSHILVMDFIGEDGWPAPLLKNTEFDTNLADKLYCDCVWMMCNLYRKCHLVHADLSEFNLLLFDEKLYIIDVSQSVEHDHPHSLEFLRSDISNITKFFRQRGAAVLEMGQLFKLIVDSTININNKIQESLDNLRTKAELPNEILFMQAYIPHKLDNVENFENEDILEKQGIEQNNPFIRLIGKTTNDNINPLSQNYDINSDSTNSNDSDSSYDSIDKKSDDIISKTVCKIMNKTRHQRYVRIRGESPTERNKRKKNVKIDKQKRRETKIPKKVKKRREKIIHKR